MPGGAPSPPGGQFLLLSVSFFAWIHFFKWYSNFSQPRSKSPEDKREERRDRRDDKDDKDDRDDKEPEKEDRREDRRED